FDEALETYGVKYIKQNITSNLADQQTMMSKIKAAQNSLWSLITKLSSAFDHPHPATHYLFEDASEISENGIKNILFFYKSGKSCFLQVLNQDVYKTEHRDTSKHDIPEIHQTSSSFKVPKQCRTTTKKEKNILAQLWKGEEKLTETKVTNIQTQLPDWTEERIKHKDAILAVLLPAPVTALMIKAFFAQIFCNNQKQGLTVHSIGLNMWVCLENPLLIGHDVLI
ncbi:1800_t:CDS:2, partial [Racocetra fulgida]